MNITRVTLVCILITFRAKLNTEFIHSLEYREFYHTALGRDQELEMLVLPFLDDLV